MRSLAPALEVFRAALRLGLTSFGGPIAHLGYFHEEYVRRRRWLDERTYGDLVALAQVLPGPASSQVGIAIGLLRAGLPGGLAAWLGFTLPSAALLAIFALALHGEPPLATTLLHGLLVVPVAVVAQAVWSMAGRLAPDRARASMALGAAVVLLLVPSALAQVMVIVAGALIGWRWLPAAEAPAAGAAEGPAAGALPRPVSRRAAALAGIFFVALLAGLPLARLATGARWVAVADAFYRAGALVFGGGHVVLPLLQAAVVPNGWVTQDQFLAGYGAAQAVPGPLFTFAAYLGAVIGGWPWAVLATVAIFLPAFLLVIGAWPFWAALRQRPRLRAALDGVNAAVVGILLAAWYNPIFTQGIRSPGDFAVGLVSFGLLVVWKWPSWRVVLLAVAASGALQVAASGRW